MALIGGSESLLGGPRATTVEVRSEEVVRLLREAATKIGDFTVPNRALAARLYAETMRSFDAESNDGVPWAPLAPRTIAWKKSKGYERKLQNTGALRQSFLPFYDSQVAGVGALSTRAHADISAVHEFGDASRRIPARPMLPREHVAAELAMKVYGFYVAKATKGEPT